ncbi:hypothetical protein ACQ5JZ_22205, partial [Streptomyces sp. ZG43]
RGPRLGARREPGEGGRASGDEHEPRICLGCGGAQGRRLLAGEPVGGGDQQGGVRACRFAGSGEVSTGCTRMPS